MDNLLYIPPELFLHVLTYLHLPSILNLSSVSKDYFSLLTDGCGRFFRSCLMSILKTPLKYDYTYLDQYNNINHTQYKTWFQAYVGFSREKIKSPNCVRVYIRKNYFEMVRVLFGVCDQRCAWSSIYNAFEYGNRDIIQHILQYPNIEYMQKLNDMFVYCCRYGYTNAFEVLLEDSRVDPCYNNNRALKKAQKHKHEDIIQRLLIHCQTISTS